MATVIESIKAALAPYNGEWKEKKGLWSFSTVIAERMVFLSKKKLTYAARLRVDDSAKTLHFSEILTESASGLSSGGDIDGGISTGFGVKTETYNTFNKPRQGTIEEQSLLFGKEYTYQFDFSAIRSSVQQAAEAHGYGFDYQVLPVK